MNKKLLLKENKKLNTENIELLNDIYTLISDESNYLDKEMVKLKYIPKKQTEKLLWNNILVGSNGFFNLIKKIDDKNV